MGTVRSRYDAVIRVVCYLSRVVADGRVMV